MGLPPYDPIAMEFENNEDLEGTQVIHWHIEKFIWILKKKNYILKAIHEVIPLQDASIWFCGKEMQTSKKLGDIVGKNEKTKVIIKIQKVLCLKSFIISFFCFLLKWCVLRRDMVHQPGNQWSVKKNKRKWWLTILKSKRNGR